MNDQEEMSDQDIIEADPYHIEPLALPSGGMVEFFNANDLTGGELRKLRAVVKLANGEGAVSNDLSGMAITLLVSRWTEVYAAPQRGSSTPGRRLDNIPLRDPSALDKLRASDLSALERHLDPVVRLLTRGPGDEDPK
jgi:hypothetical protein